MMSLTQHIHLLNLSRPGGRNETNRGTFSDLRCPGISKIVIERLRYKLDCVVDAESLTVRGEAVSRSMSPLVRESLGYYRIASSVKEAAAGDSPLTQIPGTVSLIGELIPCCLILWDIKIRSSGQCIPRVYYYYLKGRTRG